MIFACYSPAKRRESFDPKTSRFPGSVSGNFLPRHVGIFAQFFGRWSFLAIDPFAPVPGVFFGHKVQMSVFADPADKHSARGQVLKDFAVGIAAVDEQVERGSLSIWAGELDGVSFEEIVYEGYASGGVAMIVMVLTDNKNRAAAEIRHIFSKHGSSFATQGSVTRGFERRGQIIVDSSIIEEDRLMDIILEAGADDMQTDGDQYEVLTTPQAFLAVTEALEAAEVATLSAELSQIPETPVPVADKSVASSVLRFISELEDNDDVQDVYTNMDMSKEVMEQLADED